MLSMKCIIPTEAAPAQGYIWAMHPHGRMFYTPSMLVQLSDVFREHLCPTGREGRMQLTGREVGRLDNHPYALVAGWRGRRTCT